jgi:hypothetical protein
LFIFNVHKIFRFYCFYIFETILSVPKAAPIYSAETKDCDFFRWKVDHSKNTDNSEKTRPTNKSEKCQNHDHYIMIHATVE